MLKVYVAGKVEKRNLKAPGVEFLCPRARHYVCDDENFYVPRDLYLLNQADALLLIIETGEERNSLFEAGVAWAQNKPIIAVLEVEKHKADKYRFTTQLATSVAASTESALKIIAYMAAESYTGD